VLQLVTLILSPASGNRRLRDSTRVGEEDLCPDQLTALLTIPYLASRCRATDRVHTGTDNVVLHFNI